jgi:hypothetical protein
MIPPVIRHIQSTVSGMPDSACMGFLGGRANCRTAWVGSKNAAARRHACRSLEPSSLLGTVSAPVLGS